VVSTGGTFAYKDRALEMPDTMNVVYEMDDFIMTWEHNGGVQVGPFDQLYGLSYVGTNGTLVIDRSKWRIFPEGGDKDFLMEKPEDYLSDEKSHVNHVQNFIECVKTRNNPAADIEIGHKVCTYAHLGNIAFKTGNRLVYDGKTNSIKEDQKATVMLTPDYRRPYELPKL